MFKDKHPDCILCMYVDVFGIRVQSLYYDSATILTIVHDTNFYEYYILLVCDGEDTV